MSHPERLSHEFIDTFPEELEADKLYISLAYDTTVHLCACGCGEQVLLPLDPTAWRFTYDGATVSMAPSVGNWSFPCRSHYWIDRSRIRWAGAWTDEQVESGRRQALRERGVLDTPGAHSEEDEQARIGLVGRIWRRLGRWVRRLGRDHR